MFHKHCAEQTNLLGLDLGQESLVCSPWEKRGKIGNGISGTNRRFKRIGGSSEWRSERSKSILWSIIICYLILHSSNFLDWWPVIDLTSNLTCCVHWLNSVNWILRRVLEPWRHSPPVSHEKVGVVLFQNLIYILYSTKLTMKWLQDSFFHSFNINCPAQPTDEDCLESLEF